MTLKRNASRPEEKWRKWRGGTGSNYLPQVTRQQDSFLHFPNFISYFILSSRQGHKVARKNLLKQVEVEVKLNQSTV
jgi:hypothetical protein